ncbi:MAG: hypothetical protein PUA81_09790 [Oscillospiraceae bacterium]|nr:hypothetical protein [Oscillospiraceae bacterium]
MAKKITALPSVVIMPDGSEKELDSFTQEEREEWSDKMCQRIGDALSEKYTGRPKEWNLFIKKLAS